MKSRNIRKIVSFFLQHQFGLWKCSTAVRNSINRRCREYAAGDTGTLSRADCHAGSSACRFSGSNIYRGTGGTECLWYRYSIRSITLDGSLADWENVAEISVGVNNIKGWKAALSPDETVLYLAMFTEGNLARCVCMVFLPLFLYTVEEYLETGKVRLILAETILFALMALCHLGYAGMIALAMLVYLLVYRISYGPKSGSIHIIGGILFAFCIIGIWMVPSLSVAGRTKSPEPSERAGRRLLLLSV